MCGSSVTASTLPPVHFFVYDAYKKVVVYLRVHNRFSEFNDALHSNCPLYNNGEAREIIWLCACRVRVLLFGNGDFQSISTFNTQHFSSLNLFLCPFVVFASNALFNLCNPPPLHPRCYQMKPSRNFFSFLRYELHDHLAFRMCLHRLFGLFRAIREGYSLPHMHADGGMTIG